MKVTAIEQIETYLKIQIDKKQMDHAKLEAEIGALSKTLWEVQKLKDQEKDESN